MYQWKTWGCLTPWNHNSTSFSKNYHDGDDGGECRQQNRFILATLSCFILFCQVHLKAIACKTELLVPRDDLLHTPYFSDAATGKPHIAWHGTASRSVPYTVIILPPAYVVPGRVNSQTLVCHIMRAPILQLATIKTDSPILKNKIDNVSTHWKYWGG